MVGHYRITAKLGAGGMGEDFLAEDMRLERKVAGGRIRYKHGHFRTPAVGRERHSRRR